jgi:hypothetical protein
MTLTGILKNILLVIISVMIWHTAITPLQFVGYSIALAGLLYYSLGKDQIVALGQAAWVYARGGYEAVRGSPGSGSGGDEAGQGQAQGQGGLPAAVRRALIMAVAAVVVLVLVGWFFYRAGGEGPASVGEFGGVNAS